MVPRAPGPGDVPPYRPQLLRDDSTHSKLSVPFSSHSNEADDEQSTDPDDPDYDMESTPDSPQYEGEDTRLTSDRELAGFYMYGWAAEVSMFLYFLYMHCDLHLTSCEVHLPSCSVCASVWQASGSELPDLKLHHLHHTIIASQITTNMDRSLWYVASAHSSPLPSSNLHARTAYCSPTTRHHAKPPGPSHHSRQTPSIHCSGRTQRVHNVS